MLKDFFEGEIKNNEVIIPEIQNISSTDIAIVGINCRFPFANNLDQFLDLLKNGLDCIREFPDTRKKDVDILLNIYNKNRNENIYYHNGAFFNNIDEFDYNFFNISLNEAKYIDPNQRIFLEVAYGAIEDAGYSIDTIRGTDTGVFLGFSSNFDTDYASYIKLINPSLSEYISVPGNISPIIASRVSYFFDLKGPSVVYNTACSSALVAVHYACQSIIIGECEQAIVGGIKLRLLPVLEKEYKELGLRAPDGKCKTFDDSSDGIGNGEGSAVLILKPLYKAINDNNHIYAVIKGSACNQDGDSIGITAPNVDAQEKLLIKAWNNAGIDPETISYIEAHGTGTNLGDPIEIQGINNAFVKFTDKKQFCGIGSVKTNLGHLDHASALPGFLKLILSLKTRILFPSINFNIPNNKIKFEDSPVYVVNKIQEYQNNENILRCGINSFGLSGTNCHIVLEEFREKKSNIIKNNTTKNKYFIFTLSAFDDKLLIKLIDKFYIYLVSNNSINLEDICFTVNTGRNHFSHRIFVIFNNIDELIFKLEKYLRKLTSYENSYYGYHYIISEKKENQDEFEIKQSKLNDINFLSESLIEKINLENDNIEKLKELGKLYIKGAKINWNKLYLNKTVKKVSLPLYPFKKSRCWIDFDPDVIYNFIEEHPLVHELIEKNTSRIVYKSVFNVNKQWILSEHQVNNQYIVPGTAFIEMIFFVLNKHFPEYVYELSSLLFIKLLRVEENQNKDVHIVIEMNDMDRYFKILSKNNETNEWEIHTEGKIGLNEKRNTNKCDIYKIKNENNYLLKSEKDLNPINEIHVGPRWDSLKELFVDGFNVIAKLKLNDRFLPDLELFKIHPALIDHSVNIANGLFWNETYLPLSYKKIIIYQKIPEEFFCYIRCKNKEINNDDIISFDIKLIDINNNVLIEISDYTIKKMNNYINDILFKNHFHKLYWEPVLDEVISDKKNQKKSVIVITSSNSYNQDFLNEVNNQYNNIIKISLSEIFEKKDENTYFINDPENQYLKIFKKLDFVNIKEIIFLYKNTIDIKNIDCNEELKKSYFNLFYLIKSLIKQKHINGITLFIISNFVHSITGSENFINLFGIMLFNLGKVAQLEYEKIKIRCFDIDNNTKYKKIIKEIKSDNFQHKIAFRDGIKYKEILDNFDIDEAIDPKSSIRKNGVYFITGGTGSLGIEVSKYLALKEKTILCLLNRTKFPDREVWEQIREDDKNFYKIRIIQEIEKNGSIVEFYNGDVSREDHLTNIINNINNKYGKINGIIHCAGVGGKGLIENKDFMSIKDVIFPKVHGTLLLDKLISKDKLDFFILFSSINSVVGGYGQADYSAANGFMDIFSLNRSKEGNKTISINWGPWKKIGMAADFGVKDDGFLKLINKDDAMRLFDKIFNLKVSNIIAGAINYSSDLFKIENPQIDFSNEIKFQYEKNNIQKIRKDKELNLNIIGLKDDKTDSIMTRIAYVWSKVLGLKEIDIYKNFNDLGGNSILAIRLLKELDKEFPGLMDITDIFTYSTIFDMGNFIIKNSKTDEHFEEQKDLNQLDSILKQLANGEISVEDAEKLYD